MTERITDDTIRDWREMDMKWWSGVNRLRVVCDALLELRARVEGYAESYDILAKERNDLAIRVRELEKANKLNKLALDGHISGYNALREVGNDLAECLQRALVDIEGWGCKTKREREVLEKWKELVEGGEGQGAEAPESQLYPCAKCGAMRSKGEGGTTFTVCDKCWNDRQEPSGDCEPGEHALDELCSCNFDSSTPNAVEQCDKCGGTGKEPKE